MDKGKHPDVIHGIVPFLLRNGRQHEGVRKAVSGSRFVVFIDPVGEFVFNCADDGASTHLLKSLRIL
ncbi:hypothetical protein D3C84_1313990 [compost metagenome]